MPLPQFLRYRLAKRGIIQGEDADKVQEAPLSVEEEVIAEDYDIPRKGGATDDEGADSMDAEFKAQGHPGCPNKYNVYHVCCSFCKETWGSGCTDPEPKYLRLKHKMLLKYPLPLSWTEVYDPGTGRFYYWDYESDYVSWLPPMHPHALISEPAALLRKTVPLSKETAADKDKEGTATEGAEEMNMERPERLKDDRDRKREAEKRRERHDDDRRRETLDRPKSKIRKRDSDDDDDDGDDDDDDDEGRSSRSKEDKERKREGPDRHRDDKERRGKGWKGSSGGGALDPMDPAAYSDAPRGTWSSGLERKNEAKTGADTTAAGPLYQMRPYPSPGDVLRANSKTSEPQHRGEGHKTGKNRRL